MAAEASFFLRAMTTQDLDTVLAWRNHPQVSRYMLSQHAISPEEHRAWFERSSADVSRRLYILQRGDAPLGFAQLSGVAQGGEANWGFYVAPDAPPGTGSELGRRVLQAAFSVEKLHKVRGQALDSNAASRRLHLRLGFVEEGTLPREARIGEEYRDIVCFGITATDFLATSP
jgi:UDP-4-amino-4,6-dideoxy-N-acetyl-beta-L-altrosamine N-acetyltransferase